jgi:glycosyltransferase involved in cell wall biosynthesis
MITVVIASYRYGHLAAHCIESLLSQSCMPERILFVDDGAHDCNHLPILYPDIEYVLRQHNLGTVANFQDMLSRIETEYVLFIGADNWLRSDSIELLTAHAGADIVTYDIVVTGELKAEITLRVPGQTQLHQGDLYWDRQGLHHGSMMYRTTLSVSKLVTKSALLSGLIHKKTGISGTRCKSRGLLFLAFKRVCSITVVTVKTS